MYHRISKPRMSIDLNHGTHPFYPSTPLPTDRHCTYNITYTESTISHIDTSTSISTLILYNIYVVVQLRTYGFGNETGIHKITYRVAFVLPWMWECRSLEWVNLSKYIPLIEQSGKVDRSSWHQIKDVPIIPVSWQIIRRYFCRLINWLVQIWSHLGSSDPMILSPPCGCSSVWLCHSRLCAPSCHVRLHYA